MIAAKQLCDNGKLNYEDVFIRQYCLSRRPLPKVDSWEYTKSLSGWRLTHCPKLKQIELQDSKGATIGWLLGAAIDADCNVIVQSPYRFSVALGSQNFWESVEGDINGFSGQYIIFLITRKGKRAYFDPVMDFPSVFNRKDEIVASSPLMALARPARLNHRIDRKMVMNEGGNYGLQQTCDPDVQRALSNHYLDLDSFSVHRHWPTEEDVFNEAAGDIDEVAEMIVSRLGRITGAILENYACLLALSGGSDSRTLAFSAKSKLHLAKGAFSHRTTWISQFDCLIGQRIASELGIADKFHIIDAVRAIEAGRYHNKDKRRMRWSFYHRTGYLEAAKPTVLVAEDLLPEADYVLRGNILDMTRANQWSRTTEFDLAHGISKLKIGGRPAADNLEYWGPEYMNWMDTLPVSARDRIYDFAFLEQLLPNTLGGKMLGARNVGYINPFNDRSLIKACIQVDPMTRKSGALNKALHRACGAPNIKKARGAISDDAIRAEVETLFS